MTNQILFNQHSKTVLNSTNHFAITLENSLQKTDSDFNKIIPLLSDFSKINLDSLNIDFIFTLVNDSLINLKSFKAKSAINFQPENVSIHSFAASNPNIILKFTTVHNYGSTFYYGKILDTNFLSLLSKIIRSEIVLIQKNNHLIASNQSINKRISSSLNNAINYLASKNNFDIYSEELSNYDLLAALYSPKMHTTPYDNLKFIVFSLSYETAEYRSTMQLIIIILTSASIALSLIFVLIFTAKFRKQLSSISRVVEKTRAENLSERVSIISNDEIGNLGAVLNKMLDEIQRREENEQKYVDFITLINENATLLQISDAVLNKIITEFNLDIGIFYVFDGNKYNQVAYYGLNKETISNQTVENLYSRVVTSKTAVEYNFTSNYPVINTSIASIRLEYIVIFPIIFNKEIIGIIELGAVAKPSINILQYLESIMEQLSVGLSNSIAYEKLENLVTELKFLNEQYQIQNTKITEQNEQLRFLHNELKENAIQLEEQKTKAVESAKVKSQFLASMSHELRTPLNSILGLTELILKNESLSDKNENRLNIVINNGKKLLSLINNILEFSRLESAQLETKPESFILNNLITELYTSSEQMILEKNLKFTITYQDNSEFLVFTDKLKLEQVLSNLFSNAVKFTDVGEIQLQISLYESTGLRIVIKDTGIGIAEENNSLIFEEFRQTSEGSARKYGGTGLGLTISKRMLELLGGTISINSQLGLGSVFTILLPNIVTQVKKHSIHMQSNEPFREKSLVEAISQNPIFLFSNDQNNIDLLAGYLSSNNFNVTSYTDNLQNYNKTFNNVPDAIVLDYFMFPNPFEFIKNIKADKECINTPIILFCFPADSKSGFIFTIFEYIIAPLTYEQFINVIEQADNFYNTNTNKIINIGSASFSGKSQRFTIINYSENEYIIDNIISEKPEMIIIDLISSRFNSIDLLYELSVNKITRNIPIILILPKLYEKEIMDDLNLKLFDVLSKNVTTKIDSLRILREKLKIGSTTNLLLDDVFENDYFENSKKQQDEIFIKKHKVLIVDDDKDTLFTVGQIIESLGYETIFAKDGLECLLILETKRPDLILLDIMMPKMDGFETIKKIRDNIKFSNLPVFALTAFAMLEEKDIIVKNGFTDLITKPIDIPFLASKVNQIFNLES
ncbi:MAG: response regulator [bacterium]